MDEKKLIETIKTWRNEARIWAEKTEAGTRAEISYDSKARAYHDVLTLIEEMTEQKLIEVIKSRLKFAQERANSTESHPVKIHYNAKISAYAELLKLSQQDSIKCPENVL